MNELNRILRWMQGMDRNGEWTNILDEFSLEDALDIVEETIMVWWTTNGMDSGAAWTILDRLAAIRKEVTA